MQKIIKPPTEIELRNLQSYLSTGEPYEILECNPSSSKKEITKKFRDLARIHHPDKTGNHDGGDKMTKINNAYAVLGDERLRDIYDVYLYETLKYGDIEDGEHINLNEGSKTLLMLMSIGFSFGSWPFSRVAMIVHSSSTMVKSRDVIRKIYKEKGLSGFFRGSVFFFGSGLFEIAKDYALNKILSPEKISPRLNTILDKTVRPILKQPYRIVIDLLDIAPLSLSLMDIIKNIILRQQSSSLFVRESPLVWQNFFYGAVHSVILIYIKKFIKDGISNLDDYCYNGYIRNPNNTFFRYSNFILRDTFLRNGIITLFTLPFEVIRAQYPGQLLESYYSGSLVTPPALDPIRMAIKLYNTNGILKFFNGFLPYYMSNLFDEFSDQCDIGFGEEEDEVDDI